MLIDICVLLLLALAFFKGMKKGFVVAICSFAAVFIGLAAAIKLSAVVANWLSKSVNIQANWLPFLAFIAIMIVVGIAAKALAAVIETSLQAALLGWLNKVAGFLIYAALYITVLSVALFYIEQMQWLQTSTIQQSKSYPYIHRWGPYSIELVTKAIPFFKGMFEELTTFFASIATKHA